MLASNPSSDIPEVAFTNPQDWVDWLEKNHSSSAGVWLKIAKKASGLESPTYAEALEVALCYGWIDGQKRPYDEVFWLQKFTPRGVKSIWSKVNKRKALSLIEAGWMKPAGLAAIEKAKKNGQWDAAYDSQSKASMPEDLQAALDGNPKAKAFFATLNSVNRYAILFRVQTAKKAQTRSKRIKQFIGMLEKGQKIYP
ncbi:MAG: YdeI/OmpD-associated family protein [Thermaceae bacterium]|nr:YdeI/OmpD-associated family protein [Thermaceae bacterium]